MKKRLNKKIAAKVAFFPHPAMSCEEEKEVTTRMTGRRARHVNFLLNSPFVQREITGDMTYAFGGGPIFRADRHYRFSHDGEHYTVMREQTFLCYVRKWHNRRDAALEEVMGEPLGCYPADYPEDKTGREYGWYPSYTLPDGAVIETYRGLDDLYCGQGDTVPCRLVRAGFVLWEDETCPCHNGCGNKFDLADWVYSNGGADI